MRRLLPPTGWMGGKRRQAPFIFDALGVRPKDPIVDACCGAGSVTLEAIRRGARKVLMVDSSSWGWVWSTVLGPDGEGVAGVLLPGEPVEAAATWLWVMARAASNVPTWWCAETQRWRMSEKFGGRQKPVTQKQQGAGVLKGPLSSRVVADRLRACRPAMLGRVQVLHADVRHLEVAAGDVVVLDPPYAGCTAYEHDLPRADVLALAERLRDDGARVAVCEAEGLPLEGWHHLDLSYLGRKGAGREWLTLSHPPAVYQAALPLRGVA